MSNQPQLVNITGVQGIFGDNGQNLPWVVEKANLNKSNTIDKSDLMINLCQRNPGYFSSVGCYNTEPNAIFCAQRNEDNGYHTTLFCSSYNDARKIDYVFKQ